MSEKFGSFTSELLSSESDSIVTTFGRFRFGFVVVVCSLSVPVGERLRLAVVGFAAGFLSPSFVPGFGMLSFGGAGLVVVDLGFVFVLGCCVPRMVGLASL